MANAPEPPPPPVPNPPHTRMRRRVALLVLLVTAGAGAAWWVWPPRLPPGARTEPDEVPDDDTLLVNNPGYVGPGACAPCHAARTTEFQKTRHFKACWTPEQGPMPPGFTPERSAYTSRQPGVRFQFARTGGDFLETVIRDGPTGRERYPLRIDLIYGAHGRADEVYFTWQGDRLCELPMGWLHPSGEWGEQRLNPNHPGDATRTATTRCVECHNTWLGHVPGTENEYRRDRAVLGVTCESCHGPGREHVAAHRDHPDARGARAIVNPGRLSRDRLMDACAQCHSNAVRPRGPAFSYRPGEPLDAHFRTRAAEGRENDHVAGQVEYLRKSKCFQKTETLTCVTCHDPHRPADAAALGAACAKCHQPSHCRDQERLPVGARADCVGCHMPRYTRVAVNFHTAADQYVFPVRPHEHRIGVYPRAKQDVLLAWYRAQPDPQSQQKAEQLATELAEQWQTKGDQLRKEYKFLEAIGAARDAVRVKPTSAARDRVRDAVALRVGLDNAFLRADHQFTARQYPDAIRTLEDALKVKPDWAQAHGKLGTIYATAGDRPRAVEHLRAVARHDPDDPYGYNMLGWLAYLDGKSAEAVEHFRRADAVSPFTAEINYRWGLALLALETWPDAAARFRQALAVDPNHGGSCQGISHALRKQGQASEAVTFARKAVRLTGSKNPDVLLTLADALVDAGRPDEAESALSRALDAGPSPELVTQIRRRVEDLRRRKN